jgi:hypothetical protein
MSEEGLVKKDVAVKIRMKLGYLAITMQMNQL